MAARGFAKRYSQAVFEIAREREELDRWQSDLEKIARLSEDATLRAWLENPRVPFDLKAKSLSEQPGDLSPLAVNLACLLVAKGRLDMAADISGEYQRLLNSYRGIEEAELTTAITLNDEDQADLAERLGAIVGKKVVLKTKVDPGLIGGFAARIGDRLLDASTRSRLDTLEKELAR